MNPSTPPPAADPTSLLSSSPKDPTIRHAGRAHIRGKIRRVWRPRYLELCDNGLVRYYELPPTADITLTSTQDWDHVGMIPKDTLVVYSARIIDVTTLRDLHVGLPRGSYGFLFRGQRHPSSRSQFIIQQHQKQAVTDYSTSGPREFCCAVATLEEAQTWVVALQWAAAITPSLSRSNSDFQSSSLTLLPPNDDDSPQLMNERHGKVDRELEDATITDKSIDSSSQRESSSRRAPDKKPSSPSIIVTKVQRLRMTRVSQFQWKPAIEVDFLLVKSPKVEERTIVRTLDDTIRLLKTLQDLPKVAPKREFLHSCMEKVQSLDDKKTANLANCLPDLNDMLRKLVTDAAMVNTPPIKVFLGIVTTTSSQNSFSKTSAHQDTKTNLWTLYNPSTVLLYHRSTIIEKEELLNAYCKNWLSKESSTSILHVALYGLWRRPEAFMVVVAVLLPILIPTWHFYNNLIPTLRLRLDILVALCCACALGGQRSTAATATPGTVDGAGHKPRQRRRGGTPATGTTSSLDNESYLSVGISHDEGSKDAQGPIANDDNLVVDDSESSLDEEAEADWGDDRKQLSSPLLMYPANGGESCWSEPDDNIFKVRGPSYLEDRIKIPSDPAPFKCLGVDVWLSDNPPRHIARHPDVLGGKLREQDTFLVNFLLPFGNFVAYFEIPSEDKFPPKLAKVWKNFLKGDQQYRDARLKLLPVVLDGPWIVKAAVGNGTSPALLGKVIPLQYFFEHPTSSTKGVYEVDVIITASSIAKGILSVVKGHTKSLSIAFAFIIEAAEASELPETVLCDFSVHALHLEDCPQLPEHRSNLNELL